MTFLQSRNNASRNERVLLMSTSMDGKCSVYKLKT